MSLGLSVVNVLSDDFYFPKILKMDGSFATLNISKIKEKITEALEISKEFHESELEKIVSEILKKIKVMKKDFVNVDDLRDLVELSLIKFGFIKTAKAYIMITEKNKNKDKFFLIDAISAVNEYIKKEDWRVKANANLGYSIGGLILNLSGKIVANYWLEDVYKHEISDAHRNGDFHIHDLDMLSGYCAGWSLRMLIEEGFNGIPGKVESSPPKHLCSAFGQVVNFLGTLQNEWAGAQAFSSFDTYMAPFVKKDNLSYDSVRQEMQELIYSLNVPSRWGAQAPFTNFTFDWICPDDLKEKRPIICGEEMPFKYGDLSKEMGMINKAYIDVMIAGDSKKRLFSFPIPTYNITKDFDWNGENVNLLFEMTAKYGIPYFQNFVNSDLNPNMIRSMCCRLQLDLRELLKRGNSLFGSAEQTGSIGVVTINGARLGYLFSGNEDELLAHLKSLMKLACESLELKRKIIKEYMDFGFYPFSKRYLGTFKNHFSTIGINGVNEMILNFTSGKNDITDEYGKNFAIKFLDFMREQLVIFQEETGHLYNLEATPAEGAMYRFAREDQKRYPGIIQSGEKDAPFYTNSSQLPVDYTTDPFEALEHQNELQTKYTGGTVIHLYMGERISSGENCKKLIKKALENYRVPYITITPTFSICPKHGYLDGEHQFCPICDDEILEKKKKETRIKEAS